jgi:hypothetical protein
VTGEEANQSSEGPNGVSSPPLKRVHWCPDCRCRLYLKKGRWTCTRRSCKISYLVFNPDGSVSHTVYKPTLTKEGWR